MEMYNYQIRKKSHEKWGLHYVKGVSFCFYVLCEVRNQNFEEAT